MTTPASILGAELETKLRGRVIRSGDGDYDEARAVYNAMHDRRPALIVRCADTADVAETIRYAAANDIELAVRGGGHSAPGFGTIDDGLVLDLSGLRAVEVDPERRIARAQGGCTVADVDDATHEHGLATTLGTISTTGIGGLTLGGGFGHLTRRFGLSCDNLIGADVVTADGEAVRADEKANPDLFWALRGGGGNFGVVTRFDYRVHPVGELLGGPLVFPMEAAADVLRAYAALLDDAPDDLGGILGLALLPPFPFLDEARHLTPGCIVLVCWTGSPSDLDAVLAPLRAAAEPLGEGIGPMPYPVMNTLFDELLPPGLQHRWKASFARDLSDAAIAALVDGASRWSVPQSGTFLFPLSGAAARVDAEATAFGHRDARFNVLLDGSWPDATRNAEHTRMIDEYFDTVRPHLGEGGYVNFASADDAPRAPANYGANYERLARIKATYDPTNLFHVNQNIEPRA